MPTTGKDASAAARAFDQRDEGGVVVLLTENPWQEVADDARTVAAVCPVLTIRIQE
ncbi:ferredoxin [Streptomyces hokutonensis]|uniref:ferredoxin n=1 Tax=Streptomyces hokutonensis TaxID=1306990 RepID=UPI0036899B13